MKRFNIVVLNYKRLDAFINNTHRLANLSGEFDRITVLSASPSPEEQLAVERLQKKTGLPVKYITRNNIGIDQYARVEYFTGQLEPLAELNKFEYIFQFQDHYLDIDSDFSRWGAAYDFRIKGDVIPEGIVLDFNDLYSIFKVNDIAGAFCDRHNPSWFAIKGAQYIAPSGGNFFIRTSLLEGVQDKIKSLGEKCDNTYRWAVYAEYKWGEIFFPEGRNYYDIKRKSIFSTFKREDFYVDIYRIQIPDKWFENSFYRFFYPVFRSLKKIKNSFAKIMKSDNIK